MKLEYVKWLFYCLIILLLSCSISEPIDNVDFNIKEIDIAVTEIYLNISFSSAESRELELYQNNTPIKTFTCMNKDTVIRVSKLTADTQYNLQISEIRGDKIFAKSNVLFSKTLKATSHDIPWKSVTVSLDNYGVVHDYFVIDLNDIWLVGVFYVGSEVSEYGALHWDGIEWNYLRLYSDTPYPDLKTNITPSGLFAFNENDIWFADKSVFHWDGDTLTPYWLTYFDGDNPDAIFGKGQRLNSIWGNTKNGYVYAYGKGALAVFIENQWHKIPIDPNWTVTDMQEYLNPLTGESEIICSAIDWNIPQGFLFKINDRNGTAVIPWNIYIGSMEVWSNKGFPLYAGGLDKYSNEKGNWDKIDLEGSFTPSNICGTTLNNIFISGSNSTLYHFNGKDWKNIGDILDGQHHLTAKMNDKFLSVLSEGNGSITVYISLLE